MKEKFWAHKKKIILSILLAASFLFPPLRAVLPGLEIIIPNDEVSVEQK
jgi:hypothetical protein